MDIATLFYPSIAVGCSITVIWLISVKITDVSIVDIWWGPGFALVSWMTLVENASINARQLLTASLLTLWGLRLGIYLAKRNLGHDEDRRYQAIRGGSPHFWWTSFFKVFLLQGSLQLFVSLPVYAVASASNPLGLLDAVGMSIAFLGLATEGIADHQLTRFKNDAANEDKVMRTGLWGWSRHPNYFGNALMWLGFGLIGMAAGGPMWMWIGPAVMWFLLLRVSGVTMLEKTIVHRRPAYQAYINEVSAFIPLPPRSSSNQESA